MDVSVDYRRHNSLATEIHVSRTSRDFHVSSWPGTRKAIVFDDEDRIFDRCASVANDEASTFEYGHSRITPAAAGDQDSSEGKHGRHRDYSVSLIMVSAHENLTSKVAILNTRATR